MTQRAENLFENEIRFYVQKIETECFKEIDFKNLNLESKSSFVIINSLKELVRKRFEFLKQIKNRNTIFDSFIISLQDIYNEIKNIIINNYDEKVSISKNKHFKECYNDLMMFFVSIFKKFEII